MATYIGQTRNYPMESKIIEQELLSNEILILQFVFIIKLTLTKRNVGTAFTSNLTVISSTFSASI